MTSTKKICCHPNRCTENAVLKSPREKGYKSQRLGLSLNNHKWSDCSFIIEGEKVPAHKLILSCSSPVFESMLNGELATSNPIEITDVMLEDFKAMLLYLYQDFVEIESSQQAWSLIYLCEKYMLEENLREHCIQYITKHLSVDTLALSYENSLLYNLPELAVLCKNDMVHCARELMLLSNYHMCASTLRDFLDLCSKKSAISDDSNWGTYMIMGAISWAGNECYQKNLPAIPVNILNVLEENKLLSYIDRFNFKDLNTFGNCDADLKMQLINFAKFTKEVLDLYQKPSNFTGSLPAEGLDKFVPKKKPIVLRECYKPIEAVRILNVACFDTPFSVDRDCFLSAVLLSTLQMPEFSYGGVTVTINDELSKMCYSEFKVIEQKFDFRDGTKLNFNDIVFLQANHRYNLKVQYSFEGINGRVLLYSFSPELYDKCTTFRFEPKSSVVTGLSFYPL